MSQCTERARHRAARRPVTPLTTFGQAITGPAGRRAAIAVASSGAILTFGASSAIAGPVAQTVAPVETANLTVTANPAGADTATDHVAVSRSVKVAKDAKWSLGAEVEVTVKQAPEPEPEPVQAETYDRGEVQSSRSGERSEAPEYKPAADVSGLRAQIIDIAYRYIGTPYVYGGSSPAAFDCSGFTSYVFSQVGISLPRSSGAQAGAGTRVSAAEAQPGDLVYWPGHIGIYLGNGQHIAARNPGTPLKAGPIHNSSPTFIRVVG